MMAKPNTDLGQRHLKNYLGEGQPSLADQQKLYEKAPGGPSLYDPGPNQALKNRRDQGRGRMGTDEYYENKYGPDGPPDDE